MTAEKLKELLDKGAITQTEYEEMAKSIGVEPTEPQTEPIEPQTEPTTESDDKFDKLFQSRFDRAMAKERKEKAELKKKLETLQKKMLTEEEKKQLEFEQQQQELEEQRKELEYEKNKMYAVKSMKKAKLSDTEEAMLLMEKLVLACSDETDIDEMIELLNLWKSKEVKAEVDKRFCEGGGIPQKSESLNGGVNPFSKEQWNITQQMQIEGTNPELAEKLKALAGVK